MFDREIHFKVEGRETSDERLLVLIPRQYADLFEGHEFHTRYDFDLALMNAHCADEAQCYGWDWRKEEYERELRWVLSK